MPGQSYEPLLQIRCVKTDHEKVHNSENVVWIRFCLRSISQGYSNIGQAAPVTRGDELHKNKKWLQGTKIFTIMGSWNGWVILQSLVYWHVLCSCTQMGSRSPSVCVDCFVHVRLCEFKTTIPSEWDPFGVLKDRFITWISTNPIDGQSYNARLSGWQRSKSYSVHCPLSLLCLLFSPALFNVNGCGDECTSFYKHLYCARWGWSRQCSGLIYMCTDKNAEVHTQKKTREPLNLLVQHNCCLFLWIFPQKSSFSPRCRWSSLNLPVEKL